MSPAPVDQANLCQTCLQTLLAMPAKEIPKIAFGLWQIQDGPAGSQGYLTMFIGILPEIFVFATCHSVITKPGYAVACSRHCGQLYHCNIKCDIVVCSSGTATVTAAWLACCKSKDEQPRSGWAARCQDFMHVYGINVSTSTEAVNVSFTGKQGRTRHMRAPHLCLASCCTSSTMSCS